MVTTYTIYRCGLCPWQPSWNSLAAWALHLSDRHKIYLNWVER